MSGKSILWRNFYIKEEVLEMKFGAMLDKRFKLTENGTSIKKETLAGFTTFFAMAYIMFVNPLILGDAGMNMKSVFLATCISAAIGSILMGILSNYPLAQAPGMGLNALMAYTVCLTMGFSWKAALAAVFISSIIFIILTATGVRKMLMKAIPISLKKAISVGIGLFIAMIGLANGKIIGSAGTFTDLLPFTSPMAIFTLIGIVITIVLMVLKVKGSIFIGLISTAVLCIASAGFYQLGAGHDWLGASLGISFDFAWTYNFETAGQFVFGFKDLFSPAGMSVGTAVVSVITIILTFTMVDMFDTMGTLIGAADKGGFLDEKGNLPKADRAMMADAVATGVGAVLGTSTVTTFVESTTGIAEGGRTGLTSIVVAIMFLLSIVISPIIGLISSAATAPALVIVGVLMISSVKDIDWKDITVAIPCFFTVLMMPLAYSISDGIGFGFITYVIVKVAVGIKDSIVRKQQPATDGMTSVEADEAPFDKPDEEKAGPFGVHPLMYIFAALFLALYIFSAVTA